MRVGEYILARVILGLVALIGRVIPHALALAVSLAYWLRAAVLRILRILVRPVWRELATAVGRTRARWSPVGHRRVW